MLRYLSAGESHGQALTAIIDGIPSGLKLSTILIDKDLKRRQGGYGRGGRQLIESDTVEIYSGVRHGKSLGSPISLKVKNKDWENWKSIMSVTPAKNDKIVTKARPGHADLPGAMKFDTSDMRDILERSSARETAIRVAVGSVAKQLLTEFGISVYSWVTVLGGVGSKFKNLPLEELFASAEASPVRCPSKSATKAMKQKIDLAKKAGDSLGGIFEVVVTGLPAGLGSHVQWDLKLDGILARALMSIQAIKGVEVGMGFDVGRSPGSKVHDEIFYSSKKHFYRSTNNAGGIEGGMTNGEPVILRAAMKPIPTLYKPLRSVDIISKKPFEASIERSDVCALPSASIIGEAVVAFEIAKVFLEKFGSDSVRELKRNFRGYQTQLKSF